MGPPIPVGPGPTGPTTPDGPGPGPRDKPVLPEILQQPSDVQEFRPDAVKEFRPPPITAPFTSIPLTEMYKAGAGTSPSMGGVLGVVPNMRRTTNTPSRFFPYQVQTSDVARYSDSFLGNSARPAKRLKKFFS